MKKIGAPMRTDGQINGIWLIVLIILLSWSLSPSLSYSKKRSSLPSICHQEGFTCMKVKRGQSWSSLFPDDREREIVMKINRTNSSLYSGRTIVVPDNLVNGDLLDYSPFPLFIEAQNEKLIIVDLKTHAWGAYDPEGALVKWGPATGGANWCEDIQRSCRTKAGSFRIYSLGSSSCVSTKFPIPNGGAPMPYCMFFNGGQALHGSPGGVMPANVSHGCVRLFVEDAEWLRYDFAERPLDINKYRGTKVIVMPY